MFYDLFVCNDKDETTVFRYDSVNHRMFSYDWNKFNVEKLREPKNENTMFYNVRISLGQNCNFRCKYCIQEGCGSSAKQPMHPLVDYDRFAKAVYEQCHGRIENVQFWGGDGLLYFTDIVLFCDAFDRLESDHYYSVVTNGSMFKGKIFDFLYEKGFFVGLSHDGTGQHYRSMDFLKDEEIVANIKKYIEKHTANKIGFSSCMTNANIKFSEVRDYIQNIIPNAIIGDAPIVDVKDDRAMSCAMNEEQLQEYMRDMVNIIETTPSDNHDNYVRNLPSTKNQGAENFIQSLAVGKNVPVYADTKCFTGGKNTLTVDMKGNILLCQSFTADQCVNGQDVKIGNIFTKEVTPPEFKHFNNRLNTMCNDCVVRHICRGCCPMSTDEYLDYNCTANYYDSLCTLSLAIKRMTDMILIRIEPTKDEEIPTEYR